MKSNNSTNSNLYETPENNNNSETLENKQSKDKKNKRNKRDNLKIGIIAGLFSLSAIAILGLAYKTYMNNQKIHIESIEQSEDIKDIATNKEENIKTESIISDSTDTNINNTETNKDAVNTDDFESELISVEEVELSELEKQLISENPLIYVDPSIISEQEKFFSLTEEEREEIIRKSDEAVQKQMDAIEEKGERYNKYIKEVDLAGPLDF